MQIALIPRLFGIRRPHGPEKSRVRDGPLHPSSRKALNRPTHGKNITYALTLGSGTANYYATAGSMNAKENDFINKANNIIMIKEIGSANREVYQDLYDVFDYAFSLSAM